MTVGGRLFCSAGWAGGRRAGRRWRLRIRKSRNFLCHQPAVPLRSAPTALPMRRRPGRDWRPGKLGRERPPGRQRSSQGVPPAACWRLA